MTKSRLHRCVYQREDDAGVVGVSLNRDLVKVAGKALERYALPSSIKHNGVERLPQYWGSWGHMIHTY